jgi:hypothetical protein
MVRRAARGCWPLLLVLAAGCGTPASQKGTAGGEEAPLREAFAAYQQAIKVKDAEKLWDLFDQDARAAADRAAKRFRDDYARADADGKAKMAKDLGLGGDKLANLSGKDYLGTPRFLGKQHEVPDSKFESAAVQGDRATVAYVEEDGDKEKLTFTREGGRWKVSPAIE